MTFAFRFDSAACSGCKACQIACKDKNQLPTGVLWRRVYEIAGGGWHTSGQAWVTDTAAYNLSVACNHCVHPKCAGVCPTNAYTVRPDGVVVLDERRCIGCKYCTWACPYEAPQYNPSTGRIGKCDLCFDYLDSGSLPACVSACPMRTLELIEDAEPRTGASQQAAVFPLPVYSHTEPRLVVNPHPKTNLITDKRLANDEEIRPRRPGKFEELPLLVFTLLAQMAVGGFWAAQWMFTLLWVLAESDTTLLRTIPYILILGLLGAGTLASLAHLGVKRAAWRVLAHLRKSWLSREILFLGLFGAGCLLGLAPLPWQVWNAIRILTAILGAILVYCMAQVYHLRSVPDWDSWRTTAGFLITTLLLGSLLMGSVLAEEARCAGIQLASQQIVHIGALVMLLLAAQLILNLTTRHPNSKPDWVRRGLILFGLTVSAALLFLPAPYGVQLVQPLFILALAEESLGRWSFYAARCSPEVFSKRGNM